MKTIRVLALNDDNHETMFITEDMNIYSTARSIMIHRLCQPHIESYDIKGFAIIDEFAGNLANFEDEEVDRMFDCIRGLLTCSDEEFLKYFDLFWSSSKEYWY